MYKGFEPHQLAGGHLFCQGRLPEELVANAKEFDELWALHPREYHQVWTRGGLKKTPRWQQAYGKDYHYTGQVNKALPTPSCIKPYLDWAQKVIDRHLNGVLLNWYDGSLGHYIGAHRDSTVAMVEGAPIVTISLGEARTFRLRPWKGKGYTDFVAENGTVFVMPFETNASWTHEVPKRARAKGRRISITLRAFV